MKTKKEIQTARPCQRSIGPALMRPVLRGVICALSLLSLLACESGKGRNRFLDDILVPIPGEPDCADPIQASGFNAGDGSLANPYLICSYEQFNSIRDDMAAHYAFGQDIDATPSWSEDSGSCTPFDGSSVAAMMPCDGFRSFGGDFTGGLDGRGYVLRNLYSNRLPSGDPSGVIFRDEVEDDAYIYNLGIVDPRIRFGNNGAILGSELKGSLENSYIVAQTSVAGFDRMSGVTGVVSLFFSEVTGGRIRNSFTDFRIWDTSLPPTPAEGGLVGDVTWDGSSTIRSSIENCYTREDLHSDGYNVGGIAYRIRESNARNLYTTGTMMRRSLTLSATEGGLFGFVGPSANLRGTNYFVDPDVYHTSMLTLAGEDTSTLAGHGGVDGVGDGVCDAAATCLRGTTGTAASDADALAEIRALSTLPADWSADDWDLRGPTQTPALKYGGGPDVCGRLCGQLIPNQPD